MSWLGEVGDVVKCGGVMEGADVVQGRPGAAGMRLVAPSAPQVTVDPVCGDTSVGHSRWHVPAHGGHIRHGCPGCNQQLLLGAVRRIQRRIWTLLVAEPVARGLQGPGFALGFYFPASSVVLLLLGDPRAAWLSAHKILQRPPVHHPMDFGWAGAAGDTRTRPGLWSQEESTGPPSTGATGGAG